MNTTAVSSRLTRAAQAIADPASFTDDELDTIYIETASIAQAPGLDSLNAATATGIALYQIASAQGVI